MLLNFLLHQRIYEPIGHVKYASLQEADTEITAYTVCYILIIIRKINSKCMDFKAVKSHDKLDNYAILFLLKR
jgi:hypothetical protein